MISGSSVASMLNLSSSVVSKLAIRGRKDGPREKMENDIFDLNTYENKGEQPEYTRRENFSYVNLSPTSPKYHVSQISGKRRLRFFS
jgi:hypothetical protein